MADFTQLKSDVQAAVYENNAQEITGSGLQAALLQMIDDINAAKQDVLDGYVFYGVLSPNDVVTGVPDSQKTCFFAAGAGDFSINGNSISIAGGALDVFIILYDGDQTLTSETLLEVDTTPTQNSGKLLSSGGAFSALSDKADKVVGATSGHVASLDASGNLADSGIPSADVMQKVSGAVEDNIAVFDANGHVEDSGLAKGDVAQKDGDYPNMSVGVAGNLAGRGDVPAEYTFRTSGGTADLGSGSALIKKMKGKSIVWNQQVSIPATDRSKTESGVTIVDNRDGSYTVSTDENGATAQVILTFRSFYPHNFNGHKVLFSGINSGSAHTYFIGDSYGGRIGAITSPTIVSISTSSRIDLSLVVSNGTIISAPITFRPQLFDLTLMFGAGNEPSSVDEFKALYPFPYYAYNAGVIVSNGATGIKTTGFNQWDEQWELGSINITTGENSADSTRIRSKNYTPVFASTQYYFYCGSSSGSVIQAIYYDANKNFIRENGYLYGTIATTPSNAAYVRFFMQSAYGTTYNNDICINLSWSGYRNGEYEAYWESLLSLNLKAITGIPAGGSVSEVIFADGMRGVGTDYDELVVDADGWARKAIKRFGSVDMGSLEWTKDTLGGYSRFNALLPAAAAVSSNTTNQINSYGYVSNLAPVSSNSVNLALATSGDGTYIRLRNDTYENSTAAAFKTAMSGVELVYELATPVEYTLDNPIYMGYRVDDFGTEQRLPADTASAVQAPIAYDVQYALNAVDRIRNLERNFISVDSMEVFLNNLKSLGIIGGFNMVYDESTQKYSFNITAPSE